jgi:hypothetical protein
MAFESGTAYPESDADDEYERSGEPALVDWRCAVVRI